MSDETEHISESQEARIDAGDLLADDLRCVFVTFDTHPERGLCAHEATGERLVEGVAFRACPFHLERGGILGGDGRRRLVRELAAQGVLERTRSAVTDEGERVTFPNFCSNCGTRLFTGNTSLVCFDCAAEQAHSGPGSPRDYEDVVWPPQVLVSLDAANHAADLRSEHHDGSWRDR